MTQGRRSAVEFIFINCAQTIRYKRDGWCCRGKQTLGVGQCAAVLEQNSKTWTHENGTFHGRNKFAPLVSDLIWLIRQDYLCFTARINSRLRPYGIEDYIREITTCEASQEVQSKAEVTEPFRPYGSTPHYG